MCSSKPAEGGRHAADPVYSDVYAVDQLTGEPSFVEAIGALGS